MPCGGKEQRPHLPSVPAAVNAMAVIQARAPVPTICASASSRVGKAQTNEDEKALVYRRTRHRNRCPDCWLCGSDRNVATGNINGNAGSVSPRVFQFAKCRSIRAEL